MVQKNKKWNHPPLEWMMNSHYNPNAPFSYYWNGGRGGLNFSFSWPNLHSLSKTINISPLCLLLSLITRSYRGNRYLHEHHHYHLLVLYNTIALNSYLGLFALRNFFRFTYYIRSKGGNSLPKHLEHNLKIHPESLNFADSTIPSKHKVRRFFRQLGRICLPILLWQSENFNVFGRLFS